MTTDTNNKQPTLEQIQLGTLIANINSFIGTREAAVRSWLDPKRNINHECGYPEEITLRNYRDYYDRVGPATRVVNMLPNLCWQVHPEITEVADSDTETAFELAVKGLNKMIRGELSWYQDEKDSLLWETCRKADVLAGIGTFSVILIGLEEPDGVNLRTEARPGAYKDIKYLKVYSEDEVVVSSVDENESSARYGQPLEYEITPHDKGVNYYGRSTSKQLKSTKVHYTRIVHINSDEDEPRMKNVFNWLMDIKKVLGACGEGFWRGATPKLSATTQEGYDPTKVDVASLKRALENYAYSLQPYLATEGFDINMLAPNVVSPRDQFDVLIEAVCITKGWPKRKFMGSERGELASSQDEGDLNDQLMGRQSRHCTTNVIIPLIDRLIWLGILPVPKASGYSVTWPPIAEQTLDQKVTIAYKVMQALALYVSSGAYIYMTPVDFFTRVLPFSLDDAEAMVEAAAAEAALREEELAAEQPIEGEEESADNEDVVDDEDEVE